MRPTRSLVVALVAAALAIAAVGCGSDGDESTSPPTSGTPSTVAGELPTGGGGVAGANLIWDVGFRGDGFVAVGNSGVVAESSDGEDWALADVGTNETLRAVDFDAAGHGVVVGMGGVVLTSDDGGTWQQQDSGSDAPLLGVTATPVDGEWVATGAGGTIRRSTDGGTTWTEVDAGLDADLFAVDARPARGGDARNGSGSGYELVAVADDGTIATSSDGGERWSTATPVPGTWWWDVTTADDGTWVVSGGGGNLLTSPDATTWTTRTTGTTQTLRGVTADPDGLLASGADGTVLRSTDGGASWQARDIGDVGVELWRPAHGDGVWVVGGASGTLLRSTDTETWTGQASTSAVFYGVHVADGRTVAAGSGGIVAELVDGRWLRRHEEHGRHELRGVNQIAGTWVVTGGAGTILTSADGDTYKKADTGVGAELWSAAGDAERIVVVGAGGTILTSTDQGATWTSVTTQNTTTLFSVTRGAAGFVAVGVDGVVLHSSDGETWDEVGPLPGRGTLRGVTAGAAGYVAVGIGGRVATSTDGVTWTEEPEGAFGFLDTLRSVAPTDAGYVAVGGGGAAITSTDAATWTRRDTTIDQELFAVGAEGAEVLAIQGVTLRVASDDGGETWTAITP